MLSTYMDETYDDMDSNPRTHTQNKQTKQKQKQNKNNFFWFALKIDCNIILRH
jgi:hypothetical protein